MHSKHLFYGALLVFLGGCGGGGGGGNNSAAEPSAPPADGIRTSVMLTDITLAPLRGARPDAATQTQIDIAVAETNRLRAAAGRNALQVDDSLSAYAAVRARESAIRFAHNRPDSQIAGDYSLFNRGRNSVIGENLHAGTQDPRQAIAALRASSGHYRNMIESDFGKIGIGYYQSASGNGYWAQIFTDPGTTSKFSFITPLSREEAVAAIHAASRFEGNRLHIDSARDEKLALGDSPILGAPHASTIKSDHRLILRPHQAAGWSYQTFGEIADNTGIPEAYLNVGKTFLPADNTTLHATYRGKSVGDLGQHSRVLADVEAVVNYGADAKTLNVRFFNSERGTRDLERGQSTRFAPASELNFSDTLTWNAEIQGFESTKHSARLYGPGGEELGGQFVREAGSETYRGAYGASRAP